MAVSKSLGELPHEIQIGHLRIAGSNPGQILQFIEKCTLDCGKQLVRDQLKPILILQKAWTLNHVELGLTSQSTAILDLTSIELVRYSAEHTGRVLWFSERDPSAIAGGLIERFHGAYLSHDRKHIIYSDGDGLEKYELNRPAVYQSWMPAAICAAKEMRIPSDVIQKRLLHAENLSQETIEAYYSENIGAGMMPENNVSNPRGA